MLGGKKQVLIVGNDAVQLYVFSGKKVSLYGDYSTDSETLATDLRDAFRAVNAPLLILFDVVEQQYRKEVVPKVSSFDKAKVIQRKLLMAFPQQQMRAFLPMRQQPGEEGFTLLLAALGTGQVVERIMEAILGCEVFIAGAGLLPLESASLTNKLVEKTHERAQIGSDTRWSILMTYHQTGGLRQIVVKDGELALTRLTPLPFGAHQSKQLVDEMAREFNATLIYLSRFGYVPTDGLDLIMVSAPDICQQFRQLQLPVTHLYPLTPAEAGQLIGVSVETQQDSIYGDIVHAAWGGVQRKLMVPLASAVINKIKMVRLSGRAAIILLFLASLYLVYENTVLQTETLNIESGITEQNARKQVLQHEVDELSKSLNKLQNDPEKTRSMISLYEEFEKKKVDMEPTLQQIAAMVDRQYTRLQEVSIEPVAIVEADNNAASPPPPQPGPDGNPVEQQAPKPTVIIKLTIGFDPDLTIEQAAILTNEFIERVKKQWPDHTITIEKMVGNLSVDRVVQGESKQLGSGRIEGIQVKKEVSSFIITGPLR